MSRGIVNGFIYGFWGHPAPVNIPQNCKQVYLRFLGTPGPVNIPQNCETGLFTGSGKLAPAYYEAPSRLL